jgi:TRAP-type C4-dicarboxylate transport system permease small subunit
LYVKKKRKRDIMHVFIRKSGRALENISLVFLTLLFACVMIQIVMRNFFNSGSVQLEELARYSLVALVFLMTPVLIITRGHIIVDIITSKLSIPKARIVEIAVQALTFGLALFLLFSVRQVMTMNWNVRTPALKMPNIVMYIPIVIGLIYMAACSLLYMIDAIRGKEVSQ